MNTYPPLPREQYLNGRYVRTGLGGSGIRLVPGWPAPPMKYRVEYFKNYGLIRLLYEFYRYDIKLRMNPVGLYRHVRLVLDKSGKYEFHLTHKWKKY